MKSLENSSNTKLKFKHKKKLGIDNLQPDNSIYYMYSHYAVTPVKQTTTPTKKKKNLFKCIFSKRRNPKAIKQP